MPGRCSTAELHPQAYNVLLVLKVPQLEKTLKYPYSRIVLCNIKK
jgi:hypothetical protein